MDRWETYTVEFRGGLISNLSPLQQGVQAPGSARILRNYEPSIEGGYGRISGFTKFDSSIVPYYGAAVVQGGGQTGTTLVIANVSTAPPAGGTVTIGSDTYTIAAGGVSYVSSTRTLTLTLTSALLSSPADGAAVVFSNSNVLSTGVAAWDGSVVVVRSSDVYRSTGTGYTQINVPAYGPVLVKGGSQTGTTLLVDGLTGVPQVGDAFIIAGVAQTYVITSPVTVVAGEATLNISPALDSSPADNAALTFRSTSFAVGTKARFTKYRIGTTEKIACVNGADYPFIYDTTTFTKLNTNTDLFQCEHIAWFKNSLFLAKGDALFFSAPFTDNDYSPATGGGVISVGGKIVGLRVFREQLIIFCEQQIKRIVGNTAADYVLQPITESMGCVSSDSIQEVSGDVMFLSSDGLRLLGASEKIGDFSLGSVSQTIQKELTQLTSEFSVLNSVVIRTKSQYRLFGYSVSITEDASKGVLGTQLLDGGIAWAELRGVKVYASDSDYHNKNELVVFVNGNGYVYRMESGNTFDGVNIKATFSTPYIQFNDPRLRKTFYKLSTYINTKGGLTANINLKLDLDTKGSIQPETIPITNISGLVGFYGNTGSLYGTSQFGSQLQTIFETPVIGSGFSVSLQYESASNDPPYNFDAATIEYSVNDRR
jgi:hypothetical protein